MKRMLISVDHDEWRAAIVNDGRLEQLEIEPVDRDSCRGNIYRAVVARVEPSLQSAFVDFGRDKQGFLPVGEIHPKLRGDNKDKRAPIQDLLKAGTEILVQVVRDEIGNKGATLSTFISLPGRYLVLMPETDKSGVSRKLSDGARSRVKELTEKMQVPEGFGLIVRTSGETATKLELSKDLVYLNRLWAHINKRFDAGKGPEMLYMERTLPIRFIRDYFSRDIKEVVVDDDETLREVAAYVKLLMPRNLSAMESYSGAVPLFARYGIQGQVESVFSRQVALPSGGSIVIDQTEALVSVDVNSGRVKGKDIEDTARATNIEAAQEIARQLVLRDLGGLVVVDFIDMRDRKYVRAVEQAMKAAMKPDKARHKISQISEFGLLELSRQRLKSSVNKGVFEPCNHCSGTGFHRTSSAIASSVMRRIYEYIAQGEVRYVIAILPPEAASYLLNNKRQELASVEREYHVSIEIVGVEGLSAAEVVIERLETEPPRTGAERQSQNRQRRISQKLDLVRNKLVQREETRVHRGELARKSGALLDFAEIYQEVREATAEAEKEEKAADDRRQRQRDQRKRNDERRKQERKAAEEEAAEIAAAEAAAAAPKGFMAWLKNLFGMSTPPSLPTSMPEPAEETVEEPEEAKTASRSSEDSGRGGRRRRDERRPSSRRSNRDGGSRGGGRDKDKSDASGSEEEGGRRRRRRRSRGGDADGGDKAAEGKSGRGSGGRSRRGRRDGTSEEAASKQGGAAAKSDSSRSTGNKSSAADGATNGADSGDEAPTRRRRRRRGGRGRSRSSEGADKSATVEATPKAAASESPAASAKKARKAPDAVAAKSDEAPEAPTEAAPGTPPPLPPTPATPPPLPVPDASEVSMEAAPEAPAPGGEEQGTDKPADSTDTSAADEAAEPVQNAEPAEAADAEAAEAAPEEGVETAAAAPADGETTPATDDGDAADEEAEAAESTEGEASDGVQMADAMALARQEIERLKGASADEDDVEEADAEDDGKATAEDGVDEAVVAVRDEPTTPSNRFVIDLRSEPSPTEGP